MKDFTQGSISRQILTFTVPIILGNLFMQLYHVADSIIVGRYLGKEALAAVGSSMPIIFAMIAMLIGLSTGASVVVSQYFGVGNYKKIKITSDTAHIMLLVFGISAALVGIIFSEEIFHLINLPSELISDASSYLSIYLIGMVFMFGFNNITSVLRGVGDSKTPLYFLILSSILNIALDYAFIVWLHWGIESAAWATVLSQIIAYISIIIYVNKYIKTFKINLLKLEWSKEIFRQCINYGLPTGIQQSFVAFAAIALSVIVNDFGTDVIAGYSIGIRVEYFAIIPGLNFAIALTSFTGQNIGAGKFDRISKGLKVTLLYSSLICIVTTLILIIFSRPIASLFTHDTQVIDISIEYLVIVSSFFLIFNAMFAISGVLRGAGAMIAPMIFTIIALWGVRIPVAMVLSKHFAQIGIWWSIPIGWSVGLILTIVYYKYGNWRNKSIFANKEVVTNK